MGSLLNSGEVGNIGLEHLKQIRTKTMSKWNDLGFLDGLKGHIKENVAQLFENQASSLLTEATDGSSSGSFETVVFPIVRRVFSKLLANDIVSVQAMNMPIGKLFYFVPKVSTGAESLNGNATNSSLPAGVTAQPGASTYENKSLYDLYYNDGLFDRSKGAASIITLSGAGQVVAIDGDLAAKADGDAQGAVAADGSIRYAKIAISGFSSTGAGKLVDTKGNEMDTEEFLASLKVVAASAIVDNDNDTIVAAGAEVPFRLLTQKYGSQIVEYSDICDANGVLRLELDYTHPACVSCDSGKIDGYTGAESGLTAGDVSGLTVSYLQYADLEFATEMGEVSFELSEVVVSVTERKLRATWSPELAQDVSAFHNIDAEA